MKVQLLIAAAGQGTRLGARGPKALLDVGGRPLLVRTLERFGVLDLAGEVVVTAPGEHREAFHRVLAEAFPRRSFVIVDGGSERQESVRHGLDALDASTEIVVIHDAARPFVSAESVQASIDGAVAFGAATVAIPCSDTILQADGDSFLQATPERADLWACQTPQTFQVSVIREAHAAAQGEGFAGTDDATLARRIGCAVKLVRGTALNFKITTPADLALARCVVAAGLA